MSHGALLARIDHWGERVDAAACWHLRDPNQLVELQRRGFALASVVRICCFCRIVASTAPA